MSRKKDADKDPTELEAAVLGAIRQHGPCTAYSVRKAFQESRSPKWSGSAGAIYPLLRRLEDLKLVASAPNKQSNRKQRDYVISRKGLSVLRRWLSQLSPEQDAGLVHDPLRLKVLFLDSLCDTKSTNLIIDAIQTIRKHLKTLQHDCDTSRASDNQNQYLAARNALLLTQARLRWLKEVLAAIGEGV